MNCDAVERALLEEGADLSAAVREHLQTCRACQHFAHLQQALLDHAASVVPAPALEQAVLAAAHRRLRRGWRRVPPLRSVLRAAAAALVLLGAIGLWSRQRQTPPAAATAAPQVTSAAAGQHWAGAQEDLQVIEDGLEAALAELGTAGTPARGTDADVGSKELWDALMELEFDVYFESESLRQAGG
jgi:hypothetical protein